jgi:hypothetical protein
VVNRCVRRAFLCGADAVTGQDFDHRRGWIETRIRELASVFTIDVAAYAIVSNHYHVVLWVDAERATALSDEAVLHRWTQLFTSPLPVQRYLSDARNFRHCERSAAVHAVFCARGWQQPNGLPRCARNDGGIVNWGQMFAVTAI